MLGPYKTLSFYILKKGFCVCVCVYMNVNIIDETFEAIWNFNQNFEIWAQNCSEYESKYRCSFMSFCNVSSKIIADLIFS